MQEPTEPEWSGIPGVTTKRLQIALEVLEACHKLLDEEEPQALSTLASLSEARETLADYSDN